MHMFTIKFKEMLTETAEIICAASVFVLIFEVFVLMENACLELLRSIPSIA